MKKERLTLKKIAKEFNVSIGTVSKALSDSKEISTETKERIKAFARHYQYKPNNVALSLKNQQSRTLGVIIPEVVHYFFANVIDGIEAVAFAQGYKVMVALSNESKERESTLIEALSNNLIDGFLLSLSKKTMESGEFSHIQNVIDQGVPVVLFDRVSDQINCDKVIVNDRRGAYDAVQHLIQRNRQHIVLITTPDYISVGKLRTQGYLEALQDAGLSVKNELIIRVVETPDSRTDLCYLKTELEHILQTQKVDAVFAVNEIYGAEAMTVLKSYNLRIPEDVAVICFTDGLISKYVSPSLSTVNQHGQEIGKTGAHMLIDRLENTKGQETYYTSIITCEVIPRESS